MYLEPSKTSGTLPEATFAFTLSNTRDETFNLNPYGWRLDKSVDGTWRIIQPWAVNVPLLPLEPGRRYSWEVTVDNTDLGRPLEPAEGDETLTFSGLGPGTYAFGIDGWFESEDHERQTAFISVFELQGDPMELVPTNTVSETKRTGDTVTVVVETAGDRDRYTLVVTRVESAPEEPRKLPTEQVMLVTPLRNALAHFEDGVRQVRVETGGDPEFLFRGDDGVSGPWTYVEHGGRVYEVERGPASTES